MRRAARAVAKVWSFTEIQLRKPNLGSWCDGVYVWCELRGPDHTVHSTQDSSIYYESCARTVSAAPQCRTSLSYVLLTEC